MSTREEAQAQLAAAAAIRITVDGLQGTHPEAWAALMMAAVIPGYDAVDRDAAQVLERFELARWAGAGRVEIHDVVRAVVQDMAGQS